MLPPTSGRIDPNLLLGFNAAAEDDLDARPSHHDAEEDHDHDDAPNAACVVREEMWEPRALVQRLEKLVREEEIYRIKGFVAVPRKKMRLVLQGVGDRFETFFDRPWQPDETPQTKLVFIGNNIDAERIERVLDEK